MDFIEGLCVGLAVGLDIGLGVGFGAGLMDGLAVGLGGANNVGVGVSTVKGTDVILNVGDWVSCRIGFDITGVTLVVGDSVVGEKDGKNVG